MIAGISVLLLLIEGSYTEKYRTRCSIQSSFVINTGNFAVCRNGSVLFVDHGNYGDIQVVARHVVDSETGEHQEP